MKTDLIIRKRINKSAVLTMFDSQTKFQVGFKVRRTADSINKQISKLYNALKECGCKTFDALLTDNGTEFMLLPIVETDELGVFNFRVFFCNPYASYKKGDSKKP